MHTISCITSRKQENFTNEVILFFIFLFVSFCGFFVCSFFVCSFFFLPPLFFALSVCLAKNPTSFSCVSTSAIFSISSQYIMVTSAPIADTNASSTPGLTVRNKFSKKYNGATPIRHPSRNLPISSGISAATFPVLPFTAAYAIRLPFLYDKSHTGNNPVFAPVIFISIVSDNGSSGSPIASYVHR